MVWTLRKLQQKIFSHQNNGYEGPRFIPAMLANRFVNSDWQYLKKYTLHIIASHRTIYIDLLRCCMYHCFNTKGHHLILRSLLPEFSVSFGQLDGHHWSTKKQERSKIWGSTWLDGCRIAICPNRHVETLSNRNIYSLIGPVKVHRFSEFWSDDLSFPALLANKPFSSAMRW